MEIALVGLPFSGKTTLFNALTGSAVPPDGQRKNRAATVPIDDPRLLAIAEGVGVSKVHRAAFTFVDLAPPSKGYANPDARTADALAHVLRAFESESAPHIAGSVDPQRDAQTLEDEFALADLQIIENRFVSLKREIQVKKDPEQLKERDVLLRFQEALEAGRPLRDLEASAEEERLTRGYQFLSMKPLIAVLNAGEEAEGGAEQWSGGACVEICAELEAELAQLSEEDALAFRVDLGLPEESAMKRLTEAAYEALEVCAFFTANEEETRMRLLPRGATALEAAESVHTDMAKGFIRAETCRWDQLAEAGSFSKLRSSGALRLEGKEYVVQDGDAMLFRFSV